MNGAVAVTIACNLFPDEPMVGHGATGDGVIVLAGAQPRQTTGLMN